MLRPILVVTYPASERVLAVVFIVFKHLFITDLKPHLLTIKMHYKFNSACLLNAFYNICSGANMPNKNLIITFTNIGKPFLTVVF